jgi:hypothetical protein
MGQWPPVATEPQVALADGENDREEDAEVGTFPGARELLPV